jgi:hypothetical protein
MYLRAAHAAIWKAYQGDSLSLSPPSGAVHLSKPLDLPNPTPSGNRLNIGNPADNLELHDGLLSNTIADLLVNLTLCISCGAKRRQLHALVIRYFSRAA